jgi:hypothetical protein
MMALKVLHSYLRSFSPWLETFEFRWICGQKRIEDAGMNPLFLDSLGRIDLGPGKRFRESGVFWPRLANVVLEQGDIGVGEVERLMLVRARRLRVLRTSGTGLRGDVRGFEDRGLRYFVSEKDGGRICEVVRNDGGSGAAMRNYTKVLENGTVVLRRVDTQS